MNKFNVGDLVKLEIGGGHHGKVIDDQIRYMKFKGAGRPKEKALILVLSKGLKAYWPLDKLTLMRRADLTRNAHMCDNTNS